MGDLGQVFKDMGDHVFAASSAQPVPPFQKAPWGKRWFNATKDHFEFNYTPVHFNGGMLVMNGYEPERLGEGIESFFQHRAWRKALGGYDLTDEAALSYWLATDLQYNQIYHIPLEVFGNLTHKRAFFGKGRKIPPFVHFHDPSRLKTVDLYHLYEEGLNS